MPQTTDLSKSSEYNALTAIVGLDAQIFKGCFSFSVVDVCVEVTLSKACVNVSLVGVEVAEACVGWEISGARLQATIDFPTINIGLYKLERPSITFAHDLSSNNGQATFTSKLFKLRGFPPDFELDKEWNNEVIIQW